MARQIELDWNLIRSALVYTTQHGLDVDETPSDMYRLDFVAVYCV